MAHPIKRIRRITNVRHQAIVCAHGPDWSSTSYIWEVCDIHDPIGESTAWNGPLSDPFLATRCVERGIARHCITAEPCRAVEGPGGTRTDTPRAVRLDVHSHVQTGARLSPVFSPYDPRADAMEMLRSRRSLDDFLSTSDTAMAA